MLLWPADSDLLVFVGGVGQLTFSSLALVSTGKKSANSTALRFTDSLTRSLIADVEIMSDGPAHTVGSGINMGVLTDSCTIRETQIWGVSGTGITIGAQPQPLFPPRRCIQLYMYDTYELCITMWSFEASSLQNRFIHTNSPRRSRVAGDR